MDIHEERRAFESLLPELLEKHPGKFALLKDGELVGVFDREGDAYVDAIERFGPDETFLISRIAEQKPLSISLAWDAGIVIDQA